MREEETPWQSRYLSMASESDKWKMNVRKKLVVGQHVEVLSLEKGLQGSWHRGMVIDMKPLQRIVKYEYLFESDHPQSPNLVESVAVSLAIDGILQVQSSQLLNLHLNEDSPQTSKRNNIRPCACRLPVQPSEATYGMCVDACKENVHWEGIILDDSNGHPAQIVQRTVFFPDLGIEESVPLQNICLSSDWDEVTGKWTTRGRWEFLEALEANLERASLCMTMQQLWHIAKSHPCFVSKIVTWTRGTRDEWFSLVLSLMHQLAHLTTSTSVRSGTFWDSVSDFVEAYKNRCRSRAGIINQNVKEKSDIARSHLKSVGWQFMETEGGARYYVSAEGTRYNSFIKACEGYLSGKAGTPPQETAICAVVTGGMSENKETKGPYGPRRTWNPVNLIPEFSSVLTRGAKYGDVTSDTMRKHLLHLGWIVEYRRDTNRPMTRYRYHSLEGKTYYSLRLVFSDLVSGFHSERDDHMQLTQSGSKPHELIFNGDDQSGPNGHDPNLGTPEENGEIPVLTESVLIDNILPENLQEQIGYMQINCGKLEANKLTGEIQSSPNGDCSHFLHPTGNEGNQLGLNGDLITNVIQSEYLPESIKEYIECIEDRIRSNLKGFVSPSGVRSNAKRHLLSAGWTQCMMHLNRKRPRLLYRSPSGKFFGSLLQACKAYLMEAFPASGDATAIIQERNIAGETSGSSNSVLMKNGSNDPKREHHSFYSQCAALEFHQGRSKKRKIRDRDLANPIKAREKLTKSKGNSNFYCEAESNSTSSPLTCAKTAISLLINKNLVMPRTRVSYRYRHFTKNGVITCNGIRCICCSKIFSATNFELHAGGANAGRPLTNIYLRDGRSLLKCLVEAMETGNLGMQLEKSDDHNSDSDVICSACQHGGFLVKCCNCPSAFHPSCVGLKKTPECYWCPLCCCRVCGSGVYNANSNDLCDKAVVVCCEQCEGRYQRWCTPLLDSTAQNELRVNEYKNVKCCYDILETLVQVARMLGSLIGKRISTSAEGLTWSILKYSRWAQDLTANLQPELMAEQHAKLCLAAEVLNECFMPLIEPRTNSDLISDLIFNRESNLSRLNFKGFYTIILEKEDEVVAVATFRIRGGKIAELPFVCTRLHYRRQGMCRHIITELEKLLCVLKVERIILLSTQEQLPTWSGSFNFNTIEEEELLDLVKHNVLTFTSCTLCVKKVCSV